MKGRRFGALTVLGLARGRGTSGCLLWRCRCDCGKKTTEDGRKLRTGKVLSCGCTGHRGPAPRPRGRPRQVVPWADEAARMRSEGMTLAEIGTLVGRSRERVRQVLADRASGGKVG
jgi:Sigma-70, region 4